MTDHAQHSLRFRAATSGDLERILNLLADDPLGKYPDLCNPAERSVYALALDAIIGYPHSDLYVTEDVETIVGCFQLTIVPGLIRWGGWKALIEAVRVDSRRRKKGIGSAMMRFAIEAARQKGARTVMLTSDMKRAEAHRFYLSLGFKASHTGFKMEL